MIKVICPYCGKEDEVEMNPDILYPHIDPDTPYDSAVYWVFDCSHCGKPYRVDFEVTYTPRRTLTYNEIKCEECGQVLYEGLDSTNEVDGKLICDECYWEWERKN